RADAQRLARSGAADNSESFAGARKLAHPCAVILFEKRLDPEGECELDGLAGGARRRDDDHASGRRLRFDELFPIRRKPMLVDASNHERGRCKDDAAWPRLLRAARAGTTESAERAAASCRLVR